jgi:hypothetical protein
MRVTDIGISAYVGVTDARNVHQWVEQVDLLLTTNKEHVYRLRGRTEGTGAAPVS